MVKEKLRRILATGVLIAGGLVGNSGCESDTQTATLIGTAIGAGAGQAIRGDTKSTLIGAAIGAAAGYWLGSRAEKQSRMRVDIAYGQLMELNDEARIKRNIALFGDREFGDFDYSPSPDEVYQAYRAFKMRWAYEQNRELRDRPFVRVIEEQGTY